MTDLFHTIAQLFMLHRDSSVEGCRPPIARPTRDWFILFGIFCTIVIVLLALDLWMYSSLIGLKEESGSAAAASASDLTKDKLESVLSVYDSYATEHAHLVSSAPSVADPAK